MNLFLVAEAQGVDDFASPTIPYNPPTAATPTPGVTVSPALSGPSIYLESDTNQLGIGESFTVQLKIDSDGISIREFAINISYNPNILRVVDSDADTSGTQMNYIDTFFTPTVNSVTQTDTAAIAILEASTEFDAVTISDRTIATIEFETIAEGFSEIEVSKENSLLINENSIDILESTNALPITVTGSDVNPSTSVTPVVTATLPPNVTPLPTITPSTALLDDFGGPETIALGVFLIITGFYILKNRGNASDHKS